MICDSCNKQLRDGAKFCGQCGAKTKLSASAPVAGTSEKKYELNTLSVNATGPDSDGDFSVEIKVSITNRSGSDWNQVNTRTQLISASGFIEETSDTQDLSVEDGATEEFEVNFYGVKARPFMANSELTKTIINVVACSATNKKLTEFALPENSFEVVKMEPCDISNSVRLLSGGIWRTDPDDDKDVRVEAKWLVQNLTDTHLPEVKFTAEVLGKSGAEIGDAGGYEELRPGVSAVISGSTYSKEKKLKGATVQIGVRVITPNATGSSEHIGMELSAASDESNHDDDSSQQDDSNDDHFSGGQQNGEFARYVRTNEDGSLICAIAYSQEVVAAWPSDTTRILGAYWGYAGGGVGYDGGFFVIKGESDPEVLDFEQVEQSDEGEKFNSLMAEVSNLYMGDSDTATLSKDGQALIDSGASEGDDKVYWDSNFQGEELGKVSQRWGINWRFEFDDMNPDASKDGIEGGNKVLVEWSIKRAAVNVDDVEDEDTKNILIEVIKLCNEMQYEEALAILPEITFEFDSDNMDSSADDYLAESVESFVLDPSNKNHSIRVGLDGDKLILSIAVVFEMSLIPGVTAEVLDEWLSDNGGWAGGMAAGQWQYSEDDGGNFASVKSNVHAKSNIQQVNCRYCVDLGKYIFASEEERDAFIKDPQFIFDFQPGNVDDKKGLIKIFGSTVNISPIYKDNVPKFIITHLEKNEDNNLGVIASVEVEMAFEIQVGIEEFRVWIDSSDSTWRYSGRLQCVGEDGLEDSEREEYEFNW